VANAETAIRTRFDAKNYIGESREALRFEDPAADSHGVDSSGDLARFGRLGKPESAFGRNRFLHRPGKKERPMSDQIIDQV
jgi:hypothetical protein